ncbi:hypothetical protein HDU86_005541 [Geranomyces michiganensis]|nr:hypothetical protein HDU86_005541 [Geranomyces michiganensis]
MVRLIVSSTKAVMNVAFAVILLLAFVSAVSAVGPTAKIVQSNRSDCAVNETMEVPGTFTTQNMPMDKCTVNKTIFSALQGMATFTSCNNTACTLCQSASCSIGTCCADPKGTGLYFLLYGYEDGTDCCTCAATTVNFTDANQTAPGAALVATRTDANMTVRLEYPTATCTAVYAHGIYNKADYTWWLGSFARISLTGDASCNFPKDPCQKSCTQQLTSVVHGDTLTLTPTSPKGCNCTATSVNFIDGDQTAPGAALVATRTDANMTVRLEYPTATCTAVYVHGTYSPDYRWWLGSFARISLTGDASCNTPKDPCQRSCTQELTGVVRDDTLTLTPTSPEGCSCSATSININETDSGLTARGTALAATRTDANMTLTLEYPSAKCTAVYVHGTYSAGFKTTAVSSVLLTAAASLAVTVLFGLG